MGAWMKMRVNRGYGFVIGGYTRGTKTFDALIFRPTFLGGNGWATSQCGKKRLEQQLDGHLNLPRPIGL
jgi:hypothetical protein